MTSSNKHKKDQGGMVMKKPSFCSMEPHRLDIMSLTIKKKRFVKISHFVGLFNSFLEVYVLLEILSTYLK